MKNNLKVGVARRDITPPLGTLLMGYADPYEKRKAESIHDPLNATALVFESEHSLAAVVEVDVTVIDDIQVESIRRGVAEGTPIPASQVAVCAIQTHSGPRTQKVWGWGEMDVDFVENTMVPRAIEAIEEAFKKRVPVRMGIGVTCSKVGINRRGIRKDHEVGGVVSNGSPIDPEMTVLRFESASGTLANLVHYGAHPTIFNSKSRSISRDWPGIMIDRMEELTGATTLFLNGAVGDIAPRSNTNSIIGDGEVSLRETGCCAAIDAMRAWRSIKDMRDIEMHCLVDSFELAYRALPSIEKAREGLKASEGEKGQAGHGMANYRYWEAVLKAHREPAKSGKNYRQVIIVLGPVAIVPFPGEPFAETVLRIRDWSPFQYTLCTSTSCGNNGYFPTRESLHRGGYEAWVGRAFGAYLMAENIDDVLVEENLKLLERLHAEVVPPLE